MSVISKFSPLARSAVTYITVGALTIVWSGIWFFYLLNNAPSNGVAFYWCYGFLLTGLTLALIGLAIGWMDRVRVSAPASREAGLVVPRQAEVSPAVTQADPIAASPAIGVVNPASASTVVTNGRIASSDIPKVVPNAGSLSSDIPMYQSGPMSKKG